MRIPIPTLCLLLIFLLFGSEDHAWGQNKNPSDVSITIQVVDDDPYDTVYGTVSGVDTDSVQVVVFVRTNRWYVQPFADSSAYLPVGSDGSFQTWVRNWDQIAAFVIKKGYDALSAQVADNPLPLSVDNINILSVDAYPSLWFSGYKWAVKAGIGLGPGPNLFGSSSDSVWVDDQGHLHLKIKKIDGTWHCAEVQTLQTLGYGTYAFVFDGALDLLDRKVVGSPFLYRDLQHEIDIEFSRWGLDNGPNAQYVVQPWNHAGNREQFYMSLEGAVSTHSIHWSPGLVLFQSTQGSQPLPGAELILHQWTYGGFDVPMEKDKLLVHINLWLLNGEAPANGQEAEIVLRSFSWKPLGDINGDGKLDLDDAIAALKILAGKDVSGQVPPGNATAWADVDGDGRIGLAEALYALQYVAGTRQ
jgi:hypothetical protein